MSGKTKHERLQGMRNNERILLIADKEAKVYHRKDCELLDRDFVHKNNLVGVRYSVGKGYVPCEACKPELPVPEKREPSPSVIGRKLCEVAGRYGMEAELMGNFIYISTLVDEWYFDIKADPIVLHHKNVDKRTDGKGACLPGDYHRQSGTFESPMAALVYIRNHTDSAISRAAPHHTAQLQLKILPGECPKLFCNTIELKPGDRVTVLLPGEWKEVELGGRKGREGMEYWYIATPQYSSYTPVGMFVQIESIVRRDNNVVTVDGSNSNSDTTGDTN